MAVLMDGDPRHSNVAVDDLKPAHAGVVIGVHYASCSCQRRDRVHIDLGLWTIVVGGVIVSET